MNNNFDKEIKETVGKIASNCIRNQGNLLEVNGDQAFTYIKELIDYVTNSYSEMIDNSYGAPNPETLEKLSSSDNPKRGRPAKLKE